MARTRTEPFGHFTDDDIAKVVAKAWSHNERANRAEVRATNYQRKLHAAGEGFVDHAIEAGQVEKDERDTWVRSFEADPGKVIAELESAEKRYEAEHENMYGEKPMGTN